MPGINETGSDAREGIAATLAEGVGFISSNQEIVFKRYTRIILPLDGFAFWVRSTLLAPATPGDTAKVKGSLHYSTENQQDEDEGFATDRVVFTSEEEVESLNDIDPETMMIGEFDGLRFAFSVRSSLYRQAQLFHYQGFAVYPTLEMQIIDSLDALDLTKVIVSNSLPIWLSLNQFMPMWPSYLVGDNVVPPYCAVHIEPSGTEALQATPYIDPTGQYQLTRDRVRLTVYGLNNEDVLAFCQYVADYSLNTDNIGIMNMPVPRDAKRTQSELNLLAQKKTIEYEVSYYQNVVRDVAVKYITSAFISLNPNSLVNP